MSGKVEKQNSIVYDYIIIGSGFGGSVSALRLSQKGYKVLVLEKGKRYEAKDFPKTNWNLRKYLWLPRLRWFGFLKLTFFKKLFVLSGVGVGGGSLVYANTLMEPTEPFYRFLSEDGQDWKKKLAPFFSLAKKMLGVTAAKNNYPDDLILREIASDIGRADAYQGVQVGVYYNEDKSPQDPYFGGQGPLRTPCIECAGCMVGCRHGAKNTLDKNYLWFAEKNGAIILAESQAEKIEWNSHLYSVHVRNPYQTKIREIFTAKGMVFSGGVLGTLEILFKQKNHYKTLPLISDTLGNEILTNSESISGVICANKKLNYGLAISSILQADEHTQVELCKFPEKSGSLFRMAFLAVGDGSIPLRIAKLIGHTVSHPLQLIKWIWAGHKVSHAAVILVMQNLKNSLQMVWNGRQLKLVSDQKASQIPVFIPTGYDIMQRFAKKVNGIGVTAITETTLNMATTAHILGGCPWKVKNSAGVVNDRFQIEEYPNMYVLDGSIIPANIGVNPSLTITAISEYAMSQIPDKQNS